MTLATSLAVVYFCGGRLVTVLSGRQLQPRFHLTTLSLFYFWNLDICVTLKELTDNDVNF